MTTLNRLQGRVKHNFYIHQGESKIRFIAFHGLGQNLSISNRRSACTCYRWVAMFNTVQFKGTVLLKSVVILFPLQIWKLRLNELKYFSPGGTRI